MWNELFILGPSIWEKVLRAVLIYVFLLVALRIGGKRELGQLNTLDFIVLLAVANAVQNGIIGNDNSITGAIVGATTLFVINGLAFVAARRSARVRRLLIGSPTVLVRDGVVDRRNLRRERMSEADLEQAVMEAGGGSVSDAQLVVIEPNGHIAVSIRNDGAESAQLAAIRAELAEIRALLESRP